jgi:hypothetical protein
MGPEPTQSWINPRPYPAGNAFQWATALAYHGLIRKRIYPVVLVFKKFFNAIGLK